MALFYIKGIAKDGVNFEDTREAKDKFSLYQEIKKEGGVIVSVRPVGDSWYSALWLRVSSFGSIKTHDKIIFARNLSAMLKAGLAISRALSIMERQAGSRKLKKVLNVLIGDINKGTTLSESMKKFPQIFSQLFVSMVRSGEESGKMAGALSIVADQMDKSYLLTKKIRGAMIYPGIILTLMIAIGVLMLVFIVPTLTATFNDLNVDLPLATKMIIYMSDFLRDNAILSLSIMGAIGASIVIASKTAVFNRIMDYVLLRIPLIKTIVREMNSARTARTLSSLLVSGVDMVVALGITKDVLQNSYYKEALAKAEVVVQKGDSLSVIFQEYKNIYPIFVGEMISVGEETGNMAEMLSNIAVFYEEEVDQRTKDMSTIIEPFLMIFIGIAVGFFALSMLSPMYSLADKI